jgi:hypothetical protein
MKVVPSEFFPGRAKNRHPGVASLESKQRVEMSVSASPGGIPDD